MQIKKEIDFQRIEKKWQKKWEEKRAFEPKIDKKREKFFFTTPYPYISGSLHIGQGRAIVESDIYCRYKRMSGFNVLFPMAFHITGTPVLGFAAAIKNNDSEKIAEYESYVGSYIKNKERVKKIVRSFSDPQRIVDFFIPKMIGEYKQLGVGVDWSRSFNSGDVEHQQLISWQFHKYIELGYLMKGKYPILYSPEDESAMGEDDIKEADSNPVEKIEFNLLKFRFKDKFLVAATLRPETVFGQTNLWINPDIKYVEIETDKEVWIISKECAEKLKYQREIKERGFTKEKLIGKYVIAPMINRKIIILPSRFVDSDIGTGIVTSVPSDAPYDYVALKEIQDNKKLEKDFGFSREQIKEIEEIEIIPIIKTKYGDKTAVTVVENSNILTSIDNRLDSLTQEVYRESYHNGILLDTCGKFSGMKVMEAKEKIKQEMLQKREADTMYDTSRKAFSRSGGKIIVAVLDNQWFLDFNSPGWKKKARECLSKIEITPESYRKQFEDTLDWLDKRPCARKRGLGTQLPFDKTWIIESLSDSTIYMVLYTIKNLIEKYKLKRENLNYSFFEYVCLGKGDLNKIAKETKVSSKILKVIRESFDYWMPVDHRHTFLLHLSNHLSFMILAYAAIFPEKYWPKKITFHGLVISEGEKMSKSKGNTITLLDIKERYGADVFRFYMTYSSNISGTFDWRESEAKNIQNILIKLYAAILEAINKRKKGKVGDFYMHKFNNLKKQAIEKISDMKLREYNMNVLFDMLSLVSKAKLSLSEKELNAFYDYVVEDWIKLFAPVCPHIAEELWSKLGKKSLVSLEKFPSVDKSKINLEFDKIEKARELVISDIQNITKIIKERENKETERIYLYVIPNESNLYSEKEISERIKKEVKIFLVNDKNKYDPENKALKARPGKPAIYIE